MSFDYMDMHKVNRCAELKKDLDAKAVKLKTSIIDSCTSSDFNEDAFSFSQSSDGFLTLNIPVYRIELVFDERLVVIKDVPILKFVGTELRDESNTEIICFYLDRSGLVYINEYQPNQAYDYLSTALFLDILQETFKSLKSSNKISY